MLRKSSELSIKDFYCVFVRTEMNLIAFSRSRNCVNTQYAALSGAKHQVVFAIMAFTIISLKFKCLKEQYEVCSIFEIQF